MDCRRAETGYSFRCGYAIHKHGSDGTGIAESGRCTSSAVHPFIVQTSLPLTTPGQGRAHEQIHSCVQGCGERSGELIGQARGTASVNVHWKCDDKSLICKKDKAC